MKLNFLLLIGTVVGCNFLDEVPPPCNPRTNSSCLAQNKALATESAISLRTPVPEFQAATCPGNIQYTEDGAQLTMNERFDNPSLVSDFYIMYGRVEARLRAAPGVGIISSFYLQSDDLDEIDIAEIFGGNIYEYQTNYFFKGNTTTYDRGGYHPVPYSPMEDYLTYGVEWTTEKITWTINGNPIRVVKKEETSQYPTSPMVVKFSIWAGGDKDNSIGTIQWAGGETLYDGLPYTMSLLDVFVEDYSKGEYYYYGNAADGWVDVTTEKPQEKPPAIEEEEEEEEEKDTKQGKENVNHRIKQGNKKKPGKQNADSRIREGQKKHKNTKGKKGEVIPPERRFSQFNDSYLGCENDATKPVMKFVTVLLFMLVLAIDL